MDEPTCFGWIDGVRRRIDSASYSTRITPRRPDSFRSAGCIAKVQPLEAGVMLSGEGLHPSSRGARVRFSGDNPSVGYGPFADTRELIAGFWIWQCASLQDAVDWARRCPKLTHGDSEIEIRQVFEAEDFGPALTPQLREQEERMRAQLEARPGGAAGG